MNDPKTPRDSKKMKPEATRYDNPPAAAGSPSEREGGDEALANSSPYDERSDEKVIVNEQRSDKAVNMPSQTAVNSSEITGSDEDL